ncbi:ORF6N domain-containing protein [Bacteroidota bacterium]
MGIVLIIPGEKIDRSILMIRGQKVMLDADLATIYGVKTRSLNEHLKRNLKRELLFKKMKNCKLASNIKLN